MEDSVGYVHGTRGGARHEDPVNARAGGAHMLLRLPHEGQVVRLETVALAVPSRQRHCTLVDGDTPEEAGRKLAQILRQEKVI